MTNAEAIEYIKKNCYGEWCEDDWREAMDIAIKALESQDCLMEEEEYKRWMKEKESSNELDKEMD